MKSKITIDVDHDEKSILKIQAFKTDDVRDKIVNKFINKINDLPGDYFCIERKNYNANAEKGTEKRSEWILKVWNEREYVENRFYSGENSVEEDLDGVETLYFRGIRTDTKETHWPKYL